MSTDQSQPIPAGLVEDRQDSRAGANRDWIKARKGAQHHTAGVLERESEYGDSGSLLK